MNSTGILSHYHDRRPRPRRTADAADHPVHATGGHAPHHWGPPLLQDGPNFDLASEEFDLIEWKTFRRETLLRYAVQYRAEQLRILFFASSAVLAAAAPLIIGDLFLPAASADATALLGQYAAALGGAVLFSSLTVQERARRGTKLRRYEKEFALGDLSVTQEAAVGGSLASARIVALRDRRRVVALRSSPSKLESLLQDAAVYRRRLAQSGVVLVAVPTGGALPPIAAVAEAEGWLWRPTDDRAWFAYFSDLLSDRAGEGMRPRIYTCVFTPAHLLSSATWCSIRQLWSLSRLSKPHKLTQG